MKKLSYFLPLIFFLSLDITITFLSSSINISLMSFIQAITFFSAGYLLSKNKYWGAFIGMMPAVIFIFRYIIFSAHMMSAGLVVGLTLIFYYSLLGFISYKNSKSK